MDEGAYIIRLWLTYLQVVCLTVGVILIGGGISLALTGSIDQSFLAWGILLGAFGLLGAFVLCALYSIIVWGKRT